MVHVSGSVAGVAPVALRLEGVTVRHRKTVVVRRLTWEIRPGSIAWIVGENGAGKSSLLRVLAGRAWPAEGAVHPDAPPGTPPRRLYFHPGMHLPARATVGEWRQLTKALLGASPVSKVAGAPDRSRVAPAEPGDPPAYLSAAAERSPGSPDPSRATEPVYRLDPLLPPDRPLGKLSTGEAKRLLLCALLRQPARFLILDEPYEHLSAEARAALTQVLMSRAQDAVVLVATNQPVPAGQEGPILRLGGGRAILGTGEEGSPWSA